MSLDDRKRRILKAIIDDYINTAEPLGSRTIARRHELGLSSATIRNEMSDLEELGFLAQPHTSAGRVPSDKGYRFYIDQLIDLEQLDFTEIDDIRFAMKNKIAEVEQLIRAASGALARATGYTSIASTPQINQMTVKTIQIVWIDERKVLVILVINGNVVKNVMTKMPVNVTREMTNTMTNYLDELMSGIPIQKVLDLIKLIDLKRVPFSGECFELLAEAICECIVQVDVFDYIFDGVKNILDFPEFKSVERAKVFLEMMDKKDAIGKMLYNINSSTEVKIKVGHENEIIEAKDCSVVITNYALGDSVIGSIGIIGPTRMDYSKVISYLNYVRKYINGEIKKFSSE